jgi:hypothetical protein
MSADTLALFTQVKPRQDPLQLGNLSLPPFSIRHLHTRPLLLQGEVGNPFAVGLIRRELAIEQRSSPLPLA